MLTISLILYFWNKRGANKGIWVKGVLIPKLLYNLLASCFLVNFDFLLLHIAHLDKSIFVPFFIFTFSGFLLFVFSYFSNNKRTLLYIILFLLLKFYLSLDFFIYFFLSSNYFGTSFIKTNSSWLIFESFKVLKIKSSTL